MLKSSRKSFRQLFIVKSMIYAYHEYENTFLLRSSTVHPNLLLYRLQNLPILNTAKCLLMFHSQFCLLSWYSSNSWYTIFCKYMSLMNLTLRFSCQTLAIFSALNLTFTFPNIMFFCVTWTFWVYKCLRWSFLAFPLLLNSFLFVFL